MLRILLFKISGTSSSRQSHPGLESSFFNSPSAAWFAQENPQQRCEGTKVLALALQVLQCLTKSLHLFCLYFPSQERDFLIRFHEGNSALDCHVTDKRLSTSLLQVQGIKAGPKTLFLLPSSLPMPGQQHHPPPAM